MTRRTALVAAQVVSGVVVVWAVLVVVAWWWHLRAIVVVPPHDEAVKANTGVGFLALGVGAMLAARGRAAGVRRAVAGVAGVVGLVTLVEWGRDAPILGFDTWVAGPWREIGAARPSAITAIGLVLLATSLATLDRGAPFARQVLGAAAACVAGALALVAVFGHAVGLPSAYGWGRLSAISVSSAVAMLALSLVMLTLSSLLAPGRPALTPWLPITVAIGGVVASVTLAQAVQQHAGDVARPITIAVLVTGVGSAVLLGTSIGASQRALARRHQAEEALTLLRVSEQRFDLLERNMGGLALFTLDRDGFVTSWGSGAATMLGIDAADMLGRHFRELFDGGDRAVGVPEMLLALAAERGFVTEEGWRTRPDGSRLFAFGALAALRDEDGALLGFGKIMRDDTERRTAELELHRANDLLAESNSELARFAYVASHDLSEPLRVIGGFAQLLERRYRGALDDTADEYLSFIVDGAQRMQTLISDLLAYSRVSNAVWTPSQVDCNGVLEEATAACAVAIDETHAEIAVDRLPVVTGDEAQLVRLFQNLLSNAVKYHRDGIAPRVRVFASYARGAWVITVEDNGIGVPPPHRERIFEMFQRAVGRDEYPGTGIGLAVCRKIAEHHGGRVWVDDGALGGAAFHVALPVRPGAEPAVEREAPAEVRLPAGLEVGSGSRSPLA